jgi:hypothetical protein
MLVNDASTLSCTMEAMPVNDDLDLPAEGEGWRGWGEREVREGGEG